MKKLALASVLLTCLAVPAGAKTIDELFTDAGLAAITIILNKGFFFVVIAAVMGGYSVLTGLFKRNKSPPPQA